MPRTPQIARLQSAVVHPRSVILLGAALVIGCAPRPGVVPNSDPALNKPVASYRTAAAQKIYPSEAPRVKNLAARASVGYAAKTVDVANLTAEDWTDLEVWVNGEYVVALPKIDKGTLRSIPWDALFDRNGNHLPTRSHDFVVRTVEVYMGGKVYEIPIRLY